MLQNLDQKTQAIFGVKKNLYLFFMTKIKSWSKILINEQVPACVMCRSDPNKEMRLKIQCLLTLSTWIRLQGDCLSGSFRWLAPPVLFVGTKYGLTQKITQLTMQLTAPNFQVSGWRNKISIISFGKTGLCV